MSLKDAILLFLVLVSTNSIAQNETNNWYFGDNAGLNFGNGITSVLTDGSMSTPSGCSSISDKNGDLLFYTNGQTVWNKNHEIMENGTGLITEIVNVQTSIIIPKPNNENVFYIFTTRVNPTTSPPLMGAGVYYSEVTFSPTKPLGHITIKNTRLRPSSTERITAIHDWENNAIKVISFGKADDNPDSPNDTFCVFTVNENGIMRDPIISTQIEIEYLSGGMKISPNGKLIAIPESDIILLYNFDIESSTISFFKYVNTSYHKPYSVEFSQNSKILYFSVLTGIAMYDIYSTDILNESKGVGGSGNYYFETIQLARNGKIYVASYIDNDLSTDNNPLISLNSISVINDPENVDDPDYQPLSINLKSGGSYKGLPNFISSFFRNRIVTENTCLDQAFNFTINAFDDVDTVTWHFGDGSTSTEINPNYQYNNSGRYLVSADVTINNYSTTLYKEIEVYPLPIINASQTLSQCDLDNDGISFFNLYNIDQEIVNPNPNYEFSFFHSENDAINNQGLINNPDVFENTSNPQELFVKIVSEHGCETISNFFVETTYAELGGISEMFTCDLSDNILNNGEGAFDLRVKEMGIRNQFSIPDESVISFYQSFQDAQTKLNPLQLYHVSPTAAIWVRADSNNNDCNGIGFFNVNVSPGIALNIDDSYTLCNIETQPSILLDGNIVNDSWTWKDELGNTISTNREIAISTPGNYSVTVTKVDSNTECVYTKSFSILDSSIPTFNQITINDQQVQVSINGESSYEFSIDNINYTGEGTEHTFPHVKAGIHFIYVKDKNNCEPTITTEIALIGFPDFFTPNNDSYNDVWKVQGLSPNLYSSAEICIYDRYGKILYSMNLNTNEQGWNGLLNGNHLHSSDYWFKAVITDIDNKTIVRTGHFSLIK